jgi:hypothetical protein
MMGREYPSRPIVYYRSVVGATESVFTAMPFYRPCPATLDHFGEHRDSREGSRGNVANPGHGGPGFFFVACCPRAIAQRESQQIRAA